MILVTGGTGFIGSNLIAALLEKGHYEIAICDEFGSENKWRNIAKHEVAEIIAPSDIYPWLTKNKSRLEAVFHMGSISSTTETDVDLIMRTNFALSIELWNWCGENGIKFFYKSSSSAFGDASSGFEDDGSVAYLSKLRPLNPYGWSKKLFDLRIARDVETGKKVPPQWAGLRLFNVYGPNEYHKGVQQSVLAQIYPHAAKNLAVRLFKSENPKYPDGGQARDFVYVKDVSRVLLWLLDNPNVSGLFNVGSGKARTFNDLAASLFKALGKPAKIDYVDMPGGVRGKYQYFTEAKMNKLAAAGYKEKSTTLEDGVADYVKSYLHTEDPYI